LSWTSNVRRHSVRRWVVAGFLAISAVDAIAAVDITDYDRLAVLPTLTGNPTDQDWRAHGAVTPVRNEGACDASWAFGVSELVESDHFIRVGTSLLSLSQQELVDCTHAGSGCGGGSPIAALRTVIARGGLTTTSAYPYTARLGLCKASTPVATIPGAGRVPVGDEVSLLNYVARGPVLALINDDDPSFDNYHGGIFTGPCSTGNPTRAIQIVGYATGGPTDYWIVKNSRGSAWGASGYIYLAMHQNICGIANYALAVSNDPLPIPIPPPIPTLNLPAVGLLLLALAALGVVALRTHGPPSPGRL
jgi:hypothetical protein